MPWSVWVPSEACTGQDAWGSHSEAWFHGDSDEEQNFCPVDGNRVEIGPTSYLSALNCGLMLAGEMRKDHWVVMVDFICLDFGTDDKDIDFARPGVGPVAGTYGAGLSGTVITLGGGKTLVRTDSHYADALIGWRRFAMSLDIAGELLGGGSVSLDSDQDFNDAFVGINGTYRFDKGKSGRCAITRASVPAGVTAALVLIT